MQGFNMGRYVPPDFAGTSKTGNKLHKKRPPGRRIRAADGTTQQTVRFEMPYAIWCGKCPKPTILGQGMRFNAVKKCTGYYHSTPIWTFRMRHFMCGGDIEIRTDPQNTAYVVVSGGKKRDTGENKLQGVEQLGEGGLRILTDKERQDMRASAFKKLERTIEDREHAQRARLRIEDLEGAQAKVWEDPYAANAKLRREFRVGRHEREKAGRAAEDLQDRMSFGYDLLPESAADAKRAALVEFRPVDGGDEQDMTGNKALSKPLFATATKTTQDAATSANSSGKKKKRRLKSEIAAEKHRESLVSEIVGNTRVTSDPFLAAFTEPRNQQASATPRMLAGIKRRKAAAAEENGHSSVAERAGKDTKTDDDGVVIADPASSKQTVQSNPSSLVEYDSD